MATISTPGALAHAFAEQFGTPTQGLTRVKRVDLVPAESPEGDDVWRIVLTLAVPGPVDDTNALRRNARQTLAEVLSRVSDIMTICGLKTAPRTDHAGCVDTVTPYWCESPECLRLPFV